MIRLAAAGRVSDVLVCGDETSGSRGVGHSGDVRDQLRASEPAAVDVGRTRPITEPRRQLLIRLRRSSLPGYRSKPSSFRSAVTAHGLRR